MQVVSPSFQSSLCSQTCPSLLPFHNRVDRIAIFGERSGNRGYEANNGSKNQRLGINVSQQKNKPSPCAKCNQRESRSCNRSVESKQKMVNSRNCLERNRQKPLYKVVFNRNGRCDGKPLAKDQKRGSGGKVLKLDRMEKNQLTPIMAGGEEETSSILGCSDKLFSTKETRYFHINTEIEEQLSIKQKQLNPTVQHPNQSTFTLRIQKCLQQIGSLGQARHASTIFTESSHSQARIKSQFGQSEMGKMDQSFIQWSFQTGFNN